MRMKLFELPHLAGRAPAKVTAPRFPQTGVGHRFGPVHRVEPRGYLLGRTLVLGETVLTGRLNSLLVKAHSIGVSPFEAGDLCAHQVVFIAERPWIVVGPF